MTTIDEIRARFERLAESSQPEVKVSRTLKVKIDNRLVEISQVGSSTQNRRNLSRYR